MAIASLNNVVNSKLLLRFTGLSGSGGSNPISNSSSTSLSSGLRFGAQAFAQAVQGLNASISFLNITRGSLEELTKITDKLISLTEKATKLSTSSDSRKNLQLDFNQIVSEFQKLVDTGKFGNREVLNLTDMSELFATIGLDKETSDSVAKIFEQFSTPESDLENMASEEVKGTRPYIVPAAAYRKRTSSNPYFLEKISDGPVTGGGISTVNSVYAATDDILNQNEGLESVFMQDASGSVSSLPTGTLSSNATLKYVNQTDGYSVIQSNDDPLGFNAAGVNQLFLVDNDGDVVHQYTDESTNVTFGQASLIQGNLAIVYSRTDGGTQTVSRTVIGAIGEDPSLSSTNVIETLGAADGVSSLYLNNAGTSVVYIKRVGTDQSIQFADTATNTFDSFLQGPAEVNKALDLGFYESNKIAVRYNNAGTEEVRLYTYGSSSYATFQSGTDIHSFSTLERGSGSQGYVVYNDTTSLTAYVFGTLDAVTPAASYTHSSGDSITSVYAAYNSSQGVEIAILGELSDYSGDTGTELYRLRANPSASSSNSYARSTADYEKIFDGTFNILTRPNAYRMLHDLKALKSQLTDNLEAVDYATDVISKNIDLVRAAGFAFLDLSSTISSDDEADQVAARLREEIRKNAPAALAQAENLQNLAVAALALNENSILGK